MSNLDRRRFLTTSAALGGLALSQFNVFAQAPRRGGTLRISVDQAVAKLNPLLVRVNPEYLVAELLYSSLTRLQLDMSAEPDLAASWSSSPDLLEWTFVLRKGVTFHDGSAFTANDVVATFEAILDPKTASPARQNVGPIAKVTAKDATTVVFTLSAPFADLPVTLAYTNAKMIPAAVVKSGIARLDREAIGTGPFKLVSFEPERQGDDIGGDGHPQHRGAVDVDRIPRIGQRVDAEDGADARNQSAKHHSQDIGKVIAEQDRQRHPGHPVMLRLFIEGRCFIERAPDPVADSDHQQAEPEWHPPAPGQQLILGEAGNRKKHRRCEDEPRLRSAQRKAREECAPAGWRMFERHGVRARLLPRRRKALTEPQYDQHDRRPGTRSARMSEGSR